MSNVSRTFGDVEDPVVTLLVRMRVIGMHTLFDEVCRSGCHTRAGVFLVDQEDFPLDPASFRVAAVRSYCFFVSGDFV